MSKKERKWFYNLHGFSLTLDVIKGVQVPGYPVGGWVRSSFAVVVAPLCTRTPNTARSRAAWLSLAEPAGVWFSIVHSWIDPSPRSSNDPVPK